MFVVAFVVAGRQAPRLDKVWLRDTIEGARRLAVKIALKNLVGEDATEEEVEEEVNEDSSYYAPNGNWSVCISLPAEEPQ